MRCLLIFFIRFPGAGKAKRAGLRGHSAAHGTVPYPWAGIAKVNPFVYRKGGAVSRFLFLKLPFICATYPLARTGSPYLPVYLVLQAPVPYPEGVAAARREPLPHVFTLTGACPAVFFCYGFHKIAPICAFRSGVPFPVRTFLTGPKAGAAVRPTFWTAKITKKPGISIIRPIQDALLF